MVVMTHSFTVLVTAVSLFYLPYLGASRALFGESCSKLQRCDSRNFLTCSSSNICECFMADSMVYDDIAGKCVALAGERCLFTTVEGESNLIVQLPCVSNGTCTEGACECLSSHYELSNGTCSRKNSFGGICTSNKMCDSSEHLTCGEDKTCVCDASRGLILEGNQCKLLAGSSCRIEGAGCIFGASCNGSTGTCECAPDKFQPPNGTCLPKGNKGNSCSSNIECLDNRFEKPTFLICEDGKCICDPTFSVDDDIDGRSRFCSKQLGHLCTENDCIVGANCIEGICKCVNTTHFQNKNQTCEERRGYGENCASDEYCISSLQCNSQKCSCPTGTVLTTGTGSGKSLECVQTVDSVCRENYSSNVKKCVPSASCKRTERFNPLWVCKCDLNLRSSINGDGFCYSKEGDYCNSEFSEVKSSWQCLPGLVCRDARCKCLYSNHQSYDNQQESCISAVGGPCNSTSQCRDPLTECSSESGVSQCQCKKGYVQVGRECRISFGGICVPRSDQPRESCDKISGLECNVNKVCDCPALQEWDKKEFLCKGLVGAVCSVTDVKKKNFCGTGSFCKPFRGFDQGFGMCTCAYGYKVGPNRRCTVDKDVYIIG